jgi:cytochrome oxidase Cu insertion factor (SCO1/SenC/PrrC family)
LLAGPTLAGCSRTPDGRPGASDAGVGTAPSSEPIDVGPVPEFSLIERSGRTVTLDDLRGRPWIAGFVFTRCTGPCPVVTAAMGTLQAELPLEVRLVSFTVDPTYDSPDVLSRYADSIGARPGRWLFLTGGEREIHELVEKGFRLSAVATGGPPGEAVTHSTRLALVDGRARLRGAFESTDGEGLARLRAAVEAILREPEPAVREPLHENEAEPARSEAEPAEKEAELPAAEAEVAPRDDAP